MKEEPEEVLHDESDMPVRHYQLPPEVVRQMKEASEAGKQAAVEDEPHILVAVIRCEDLNHAELIKRDIEDFVAPIESGGIVTAKEHDSQKQHYVFLDSSDIVREGDEYCYKGRWIKANMSVGAKLSDSTIREYPVRRKVV